MPLHKIRFYKDRNGIEPVMEYLQALKNTNGKDDRIQLQKANDYIQLLSEMGFSLGKNIIDKINDRYNIWELRPGSNRIFFVAWINDTVVLLHAFPKKSMKTPQREIDQAIREVKDLRERGLYDE